MMILSIYICDNPLAASAARDVDFLEGVNVSPEKLHQVLNVARGITPDREDCEKREIKTKLVTAEIVYFRQKLGQDLVCVNCLPLSPFVSMFCEGKDAKDWFGFSGDVHAGLLYAVQQVVPELKKELESLLGRNSEKNPEFIFTGYRSGASASSLLAGAFVSKIACGFEQKLQPNQVKIVNFEAQRVGNSVFVDNFRQKCIKQRNVISFYPEVSDNHDFFYAKRWCSREKMPVDLGMVFLSPKQSNFSKPSSMDVFFTVIPRLLPCISLYYTVDFGNTVRENFSQKATQLSLVWLTVEILRAFPLRSSRPPFPFILNNNGLDITVRKYRDKDGYFL